MVSSHTALPRAVNKSGPGEGTAFLGVFRHSGGKSCKVLLMWRSVVAVEQAARPHGFSSQVSNIASPGHLLQCDRAGDSGTG